MNNIQLSEHYLSINNRLKSYCENTKESYLEIKTYFENQADKFNMKSAYEQTVNYCILTNKFLTENNY